MQKSFEVENRLGYRILRWILAVALISGVIVSAIQVVLDAQHVSANLNNQARQTIAMVKDSATQAVFSIDEDLANQVVDGLFAREEVLLAQILHTNGDPLSSRERPKAESAFNSLINTIFDARRQFNTELTRNDNSGTVYGHFVVHYDTVPAAHMWLSRASITFTSVVATAVILGMVLYFVFYVLLTRPLLRIVHSVMQVNPEHPDDRLVTTPTGHEKDELGLWVSATNTLLIAIGDSQKRHREAEDKVNRLARYDQLTGLLSRDSFMELLKADLEESKRNNTLLSVIVCGIDDFKSINDQCGFRTGDVTLQTVADRLISILGGSRFTIARLGGDQFVIVEKGLKDGFQAADTAEAILAGVNETIGLDGQSVSMTATLGIALYPSDAIQPDRLLQSAEQTMMLAKQKGRDHFQFYVASIDQEIRDRKQLEKDLSEALSLNQLHLVYQPQVNLETKRIIGAEALIRWDHPIRGLVPPDYFIPVAENNGSIVEIGQWVLEQACLQAKQWADKELPLRIAVNLSAVQLRQDRIVEDILDTLKRHDIPAGRLELEVTETSFMTNLADAVAKLHMLNRAGISIAVDDFGTGYSSLTYLKKMPVQHLKIDKQFIRDLLVNEEDTRITNTIIDLGRSLNLTVVAEGVETAEQEYYLTQRGCKLAQGYFFSRPLRPADFEAFVQEFHQKAVENNA
ncbi:putative bifunctional diguanylate cyclase/phosphodiesterase [Marinobacter sp. KMM 10035]|uniref:putative bifunctional diguanylate cyclase/phosphodiesterase n=1 Tax=Marinobacter sp. KMM 10035 TaxID=3134034 RepID=UPI00397DF959